MGTLFPVPSSRLSLFQVGTSKSAAASLSQLVAGGSAASALSAISGGTKLARPPPHGRARGAAQGVATVTQHSRGQANGATLSTSHDCRKTNMR